MSAYSREQEINETLREIFSNDITKIKFPSQEITSTKRKVKNYKNDI